ncbi:MAG: guanylate kinase [Oceanicoccus sp.]|jgi:guanylate kinase
MQTKQSQVPGHLILILGPSGAGKGTVLRYLKENHSDAVFPLSCTTREPREGEKEGEVYLFVSREEFEARIERGDFLEYATVHGTNYYGTLKESIMNPLEEGKLVIREVDVQGLRSIRDLVHPDNLSSIFLTVDSWDTLRDRIVSRAEISEEELERRHQSFLTEMEWAKEVTHVVVNKQGEVENTFAKLDEILGSL